MQHEIQTNLEASSVHEFMRLNAIRFAVKKDHANCSVVYTFVNGYVVATVFGNGAVLRDVASRLDRAGFLD